MDEWLRGNTPMRDRVFRTTRTVLRHYKDQGLLRPESTIPHRKVADRFVPMTPAEQALYERIETYISRYYDAYLSGPQKQKPLGFIMTVYRRRLTSSFLAIERSLRRRRDVLLGKASAQALLDPDDLAALESTGLFDQMNLTEEKLKIAEEANELSQFLAELEKRPPEESKMSYLVSEINDAFRNGHDTVIIFTQYADTMDYLRTQLIPWFGSKVVCYSGAGGERWDDANKAWSRLSKTEVKNLFREGREVKILIGTDSLSEGLNLQTCGKLINYDMPWNFMRVEQRIGRVDRINGRPIVEVANYFYQGTVEEQIYSGIARDYDWFTDIVGPAQPVLGRMESIIESVAMETPGAERDRKVADRITEVRATIEEAKARAMTMADVGGAPRVRGEQQLAEAGQTTSADQRLAIDLAGLERVLLGVEATSRHFKAHPEILGAYFLDLREDGKPVTFRRAVIERHGPDVDLLTYGTADFEALLRAAGIETGAGGVFEVAGRTIRTLDELEEALEL
jgi:hypothetical protein